MIWHLFMMQTSHVSKRVKKESQEALKSWNGSDLGPATTIQLLDESEAPENIGFGHINIEHEWPLFQEKITSAVSIR